MAEIMDLYIIRTPYIWRLIFVKKVRVIFEVLRYMHKCGFTVNVLHTYLSK